MPDTNPDIRTAASGPTAASLRVDGLLSLFDYSYRMTQAKPKTNSAFMKALKPSAELAAVIGPEPLPRTEATKRIWEYIKAHSLQNPANKRNILCDEKLRAVMGKGEVTMFEMTGLVGKHLHDA